MVKSCNNVSVSSNVLGYKRSCWGQMGVFGVICTQTNYMLYSLIHPPTLDMLRKNEHAIKTWHLLHQQRFKGKLFLFLFPVCLLQVFPKKQKSSLCQSPQFNWFALLLFLTSMHHFHCPSIHPSTFPPLFTTQPLFYHWCMREEDRRKEELEEEEEEERKMDSFLLFCLSVCVTICFCSVMAL